MKPFLPQSGSAADAALPRRAFLAGTASIAAAALVRPSLVFGADAAAKVDLGLIGCGGRGSWIARLFAASGLYRLVACADYFQDRVDEVGNAHGIEAARRYTGLAGYRRLLESKLDAVVIETPPYFHPEQAAAAVEADKHVYIAKPIAVDVPGCLAIAEAGRKATEKKRVFLVDFQTRANEHYREALRRVRKGDLGDLILAEAHYPWTGGGRGGPPATAEAQLRHWYYVLALSGDFIVEQSIHSLDVATWILNADPLRAVGMGGQKLRPPGSIYDHFAVNYTFPGNVPLAFTCIQAVPEVKDEIRARVFGSEGVIDTDYFGNVFIRGNEPYKGGSTGNLYTTGTEVNIREFHQAVIEGHCDNPTVAPSVRSNLTAILGREAAYQRRELTWDELLRQSRQLEPDLRGLKA
ncbi:MAG TPA: Gfo/Idh/MocA family oxidoreductase [Verrucomicrobiota bacterium]|nr:Gfo/Idh/MocA family oxidoreductase [Verrucomicrobiota bacterium]HNU50582.1 Gfo/Idh/MocA family oxidoreductase [Verrucomicrobiota bacterium]